MVQSTCTDIQELLYTQRLVEADDKVRGRTIKKLKNFLKTKSSTTGFSYEDLLKIWKGLYYCMYMADKPLFQEDLAENISKLIHHLSDDTHKLLFFRVALDTLAREWNGIDKFRMDKFFMLVTRLLRQMLIYLKTLSWNEEKVKEASSILESGIICPFDKTNEKPLSLKIHVAEVILEELAKVGRKNLPDEVLIAFMIPYFKVLAVCKNNTYVQAVKSHVLYALIRQSELGLENQEDLALREVELMEDDQSDHESDEDEEIKDQDMVMDPRAGGVDVQLPLLQPNYNKVAAALLTVASLKEVPRQKRKVLVKNAKKFSNLTRGKYPFSFPRAAEEMSRSKVVKKAVKSLQEFENDIKNNNKRKLDEIEDEVISKKSKQEDSNKKEKNIKRMLLLRKKKLAKKRKAFKMAEKKVQKQIDPKEQRKKKQELRSQEIKKASSEGVLEIKLKALSVGLERCDEAPAVPASRTPAERTEVGTPEQGTNNKVENPEQGTNNKVENPEQGTNNNVGNPEQGTNNRVLSHRKKNKKLAKKKNKVLKSVTLGPVSQSVKASLSPVQPKVLIKKLKNSTNAEEANNSENVEEKTNLQLKKKKINDNKKKNKEINDNKKKNKEMKVVIDRWDEPLKEGEVEFEVIPKKFAKKLREAPSKLTKKFPKVKKSRMLKINLQKNKEHEYKDYVKAIKSSPGIPFCAQKQPTTSVLKASKSLSFVRKSCASKINSLKKKYKL